MSNVVLLSPEEDLPQLHGHLHSTSTVVVDAARLKLSTLSPDELLTLLRMEVQRGKLKGAKKISLWLLLQLGILAIIILIVVLVAGLAHGDPGGCSAGGNPFMEPPDVEHDSPQLRTIAQAIAQSEHPRAVGVLLESVAVSSFLYRWHGAMLDDRLAAVTSQDALLWSPAHQRLLVQWLERAVREKSGRKRILAALHAIEQCSGNEAILPVHGLTQHGDPQIRAAAEQCRAALQRRALTNRQGKELLRAGAAPVSSSSELLRAGTGHAASNPNELMRPDEPASHAS